MIKGLLTTYMPPNHRLRNRLLLGVHFVSTSEANLWRVTGTMAPLNWKEILIGNLISN